MRTTFHSFVSVVVAFTLISATALAGGGNRVGTAGAEQLLVPVGARGVALGSSYLAGMTGVNAIYYNPAGLSASTANAEATFSHMTYIGDIGVQYAAVGANFAGFGHIGISLKSFSFGDIQITDERNPDGTGATYSPTFVSIGLSYSRALTDRIRAGVTGYIISETLERVSATGAAFDVGIQYAGLAGVRGLQLGVALRHLGGSIKYDGPGLFRTAQESAGKRDQQLLKVESAGFNIPTSLELGLAYSRSFMDLHSMTFSGSFENNNFLSDQFRFGIEYAFRNFFYVRGSYNVAGGDRDNFGNFAYIYGPAFGAGINYAMTDITIGLDYALRTNGSDFSPSHVITLNLGF